MKNATSFQPGNTMWQRAKNAGAPSYWNEETIKKLIEDMFEWAQKDDSVNMCGFRAEQLVSTSRLYELIHKYPELADAYNIVQAKLANRLTQKAGSKIHIGVFNRYISFYDGMLKDHDKEMANHQAQAEEDAKKAAKEEANSTLSLIHEQLKATHSALNKADASSNTETKS